MVICNVCGRERTEADFPYSGLQVILGQPLGWYSAEDGEVCPEDMKKFIGIGEK